MQKLLHINSVVLKQTNNQLEYYYPLIKPCVHYIPIFERDEFDVIDVVKALRQQDDVAQAIAANGQRFALENIGFISRMKYIEKMLHRYTALLESPDKRGDKLNWKK